MEVVDLLFGFARLVIMVAMVTKVVAMVIMLTRHCGSGFCTVARVPGVIAMLFARLSMLVARL